MEDLIKKLNTSIVGVSPKEIINTAISIAKRPVVTTNFRPYEGAILHAVTAVKKDVPVIWCDTGYNTRNTYEHAEDLIHRLELNVKLYTPKQTAAHRDVVLGIPEADTEKHKLFTEQVKLEPFKRAFNELRPDVWFTNLRNGQTDFRSSIDVFSYDKSRNVIKVSPFYNYTDDMLDKYLEKNNIPNEFKYFDPTKVLENRECGLHLS